MSAWISLKIVEDYIPATPTSVPLYRVDFEVLSSSGIDRELFVFDVEEEKFQNVALVRDLRTYPVTREDALQQGYSFYRVKEVSKTFEQLPIAVAWRDDVKRRIQVVVTDWGKEEALPFGETTVVVVSS